MAISRYDLPAQQNVQNTYVPLPYAELAHSLNVKQNEYDFLKNKTETADQELMGIKVPKYIRTSTDYSSTGTVENPHLELLRQAQEHFGKQKEDLLNSGIDFTTPEGKKAVSEYVGQVAGFRNGVGRQIEQDAESIREHNKNHDKYTEKSSDYQGNAYYADKNVDKFLQNGQGFEVTSLNPNQERIKAVKEAIDPIKSQITKVINKNGLVTLKDRQSGIEVGTIQNGKTIWKGVSGERIKNALEGVINSDLDEGLQRESKSYVDYLLGKNSDKIFDKNGNVKNITYKTTNQNGKPVEITEGADKYFYNKKYNELRNNLQNYAINTFTSSDVTDTQTNKELSSDFQKGGAADPNRPDLIRPLYMGQGIINADEVPDYNKTKASSDFNNALDYKLKLLEAANKNLNSPLTFERNKEGIRKNIAQFEKEVKELLGGKTAQEYYKLKEEAEKGNINSTHKFWEATDPYYKQVSEQYKKSIGKRPNSDEALTPKDIKTIQQIATANRQTVQSNLNIPLNEEYQGDKLDKDLVARATLNGSTIIRDQYGNQVPIDKLKSDLATDNDPSGIKNLAFQINSYQLPVGKQPGGYNVNVDGKNYFIEYSNPKSKAFNDGITNTIGNIYDIKQAPIKDVNPPAYIQAGFTNELAARGIDPRTIKNVKFTSNRNDLDINGSTLDMTYTDSKGKTGTISIPIFGEEGVTELTKYVSPLTGNPRDITNANLPKAKTPNPNNQEFETEQ